MTYISIELILSIFQIFDSKSAKVVASHQLEIKQLFPNAGWVEEDPKEILSTVKQCIEKAVGKLSSLKLNAADIKAIGITNQRETTVAWDKETGEPLSNAIVWMDVRTAGICDALISGPAGGDKDFLREKCGLPLSTYFSALKMRWLMDNVDAVKTAIAKGRCLFGTVDTWVVWNLTGGKNGGRHLTDVTNASRTMLMDLRTLQWHTELCKFFDIPKEVLPEICSSSEIYGEVKDGVLKNIPISGILGDQQAALVGQCCFEKGQAKNTYGTGCFLLTNTGTEPVISKHGLLTTLGYKLGKNAPTHYALEGSVAIAGASVRWLRDNLGIIKNSADVEPLAASVTDTKGCYFVPAFTGLFCPYWRSDARGIICGLTQLTTKAHISRACLEAVCFQTAELLEAFQLDSGFEVSKLLVDGGMTANKLLMQIQADVTGVPVVVPSMCETTALGAAMAAGAAEGVEVWDLTAVTSTISTVTYKPAMSQQGTCPVNIWGLFH
ncbi:hypothetical protein NP493_463g02056 [Ridgeia piscesae]|uniref:Probable glycerol kinase n=1 Tax=Ridgeia piscesae TaxID=27915 RepID=A0AAD9KZ63_RIDPI|nr:hypothetical protein NP493_463g02056 [Ridgeia piscesae]